MKVAHFSLTREELERLFNEVISLVENQAHADGILQHDEQLSERYTAMFVQNGSLSSWFERTFGGDRDADTFSVAVFKNPSPTNEEEPGDAA